MNPTRRVVVTGIGAITPLGSTISETWERILRRSCDANQIIGETIGITSLELALRAQQLTEDQFDREWSVAKHLPCQVAAAVQHPIPSDGRTSRFVQLALHATKEAAMQAKLYTLMSLPQDDDESIDYEHDKGQDSILVSHEARARTGVCIGTGMSSVRDVSNSSILLYNPSEVPPSKRIRTMSPYFVPRLLPNSASGRVSVRYKLGGPVLSPTTACAAGAHAIGDAFRCIQHNDADIMIAGGSEACIDPISMNGFCRLRAMSTNFNDTPTVASRPFDTNRDGFVMSEGAAVLILEEREHALQRGIPILCEISGYGLTGDGFHMTSPDTNGRGAEQAMKTAISRAGLTVADVDYINAHATSTPLGDKIEASTIDRLVREPSYFRQRDTPLFVSSTKGATGHLLGASGALEAAFVCCTVRDGVVPPTWNLEDDSTCMGSIDSFYLTSTLMKTTITAAISNSFGFGGTNASLLFRKHEA